MLGATVLYTYRYFLSHIYSYNRVRKSALILPEKIADKGQPGLLVQDKKKRLEDLGEAGY